MTGLKVEVHLQREGTLAESAVTSFMNGYGLTALDFNRDGRTDLLVHYGQFGGANLYSFLSRGDGTFSPANSGIRGGGYHLGYALAVGDVDGDGFPDVVVVDSGNGAPATLRAFHNEPAGFVEAPALTLDRLYGSSVVVADFDGDGRQEIGIGVNNLDGGLPELLVYRSPDPGRLFFASRQTLPIAANIAVTDVDGDDLADLILWQSGNVYTPFLMRGACPALKGWPTSAVPHRRPAGVPANQSPR